jgi:hypothetical protein
MNFNFRSKPVLFALGALVVYLVTLSSGVTVGSMNVSANVAGWVNQPMIGAPVYWGITLPLRLLPASWVPLLLNLLSALCAATVLGIMIRSLDLLPWTRPLSSLGGWKQYLPGLLAVVVCGLGFNFWQEATTPSYEMVDILLFAIPLWCVLEYRCNQEWRWLRAAVVMWGLGMTQNWMMILSLPLFVVGIFCLQPMKFFQVRYVLSLAGWGLVGFSFYAILPLSNWLLPGATMDFGESWLASLRQTKQILLYVHYQFWRANRLVGVVIGLFYLIPLLACLVRLSSEETVNRSPLDQFQIWIFRGLRAGLLLLCIWLAFDPMGGARGIVRHKMNVGLPLLSLDYLCGLGGDTWPESYC